MNNTYIPTPQPLDNGFTLFISCLSFISLFFTCCIYFKRDSMLYIFTYITYINTQVAIPLHSEIIIEMIPVAIINNNEQDTNDIIATRLN
jgi:hypothetical protein